MRTTVALDDDVVAAIEQYRRRHGGGLSAAVNQLIRRGVRVGQERRRFQQRTEDLGLKIDVCTTLNLDDDVARPLAETAKRSHRSLSRVVNDLLRAGLRAKRNAPRLTPHEPTVFDTGQPLVDVTDVAEALELLERG